MIIQFLMAAIMAGAPLIMSTVGEIITEKSGSINLGVEGTMYIGAISGLAAAVAAESAGLKGISVVIICILASVICGILTSLVYSFLTVTLRSNQNVIGLMITIIGMGLGNFFGEKLGQKTGGYLTVLPETKKYFGNIHIKFLSDIPVIGKLLFSHNFLIYISLIIALIAWYVISRTQTGLNLRTVGENPAAADTATINVSRYRYLAAMAGGALCGLSGMYMCIVTNNGVWVKDCISGYGWLAVALVIFSSWSPLRALPCSIIFGGLMVMRLYVSIPFISPFVYDMCPYIVTCIAIVVKNIRKSKSISIPDGCGENYFREER